MVPNIKSLFMLSTDPKPPYARALTRVRPDQGDGGRTVTQTLMEISRPEKPRPR